MELEHRVAALERRVAALEAAAPGPEAPSATETDTDDGADDDVEVHLAGRAAGDFWALEALEDRLGGAEDAGGAVLFTGSVRTPAGGRYAWQYGLPTAEVLDTDWSQAADRFAALGHAVRMRLLREILGGRDTVAELARLDGLGTTGQIYHHLRQLTAAGWLHAAARGRYEVPPVRVVPLLVALATTRS